MSRKKYGKDSIISSTFISLVVFLMILAVVGFFARFTNNFTSSFKSFYLKTEGRKIFNNSNDFGVIVGKEYKFDLCFSLGLFKDEALEYEVDIIPYSTNENNFSFVAGENQYEYSDVSESLISSFKIVKKDEYFLLKAEKNLDEILSSVYHDEPVFIEKRSVGYEYDFFTLIVRLAENSSEIRIRFNLEYELTFDEGQMVF